MSTEQFKLDKTAFRINTFEEATYQTAYWRAKSPQERLAAAWYLICAAYNIDHNNNHPLDKTVFRIKSRKMSNNIFNTDFRDFIQVLNQYEVEYILVGGYAVILHGYNRTTGDMDIWVNPTKDNYERLAKAFAKFGLPLFDMNLNKFLATEQYDVFSFGRPPVAIDILTKVKGLKFSQAIQNANWFEFDDLQVNVLQLEDLIIAKKAASRNKDLDDLEHLER